MGCKIHDNDIHKGLANTDYPLQNGSLSFNKQTNTPLNYYVCAKFNEMFGVFENNTCTYL